MLKRTKEHFFAGIGHMAIAKRITLLYGGIFSITLLFLSAFMAVNISSLQQMENRRELRETIMGIEAFLDSGEPLSDAALTQLLEKQNQYAEVSIFSYGEGRMYSNFLGEAPPFISHPEKPPYDAEGMGMENLSPMLQESDIWQEGFRVNVKRESEGSIEYILENDAEERFMLLSAYYDTGGEHYRIQVFKMIGGGSYLLSRFILMLLLVDILGIGCAFLIGRYISRRILTPVGAIRTAAERISIEDLSRRIPEEGPDDEMKELTITFNSMIERLDKAFQRQNQFISDASHELRTPISVIQGYANLINRWGKSDPAILQESIDSILTETNHMSALIRQLLFLAKGDRNQMQTKKAVISLRDVAAEFLRELELLEAERKILFTAEEDVEIFADYDLMKQLLWIHGENAVKYSKDGDEIAIRIWKDEKYGYVSVRDAGIGIAEEDLPKIFDRFYRADKSRSKEISGTGLGLAIAHWIVESHGGKILAESRLGEGTVFTDRFPLATAAQKGRAGGEIS